MRRAITALAVLVTLTAPPLIEHDALVRDCMTNVPEDVSGCLTDSH